jgi:transposase InsO family protein
VRKAIQNSRESLRTLARRFGLNLKTVRKWRVRNGVEDAPMTGSPAALSKEIQAMIVGFRRHTLLPLDDCLYALQAAIPQLTRSSLHRYLQRYGISQIPRTRLKMQRPSATSQPIGHFRIDVAEVRTAEGKLHLFLAIDRTSKLIYSQVHDGANRRAAAQFLEALIDAVPYKIHTIVTDSRTQFADPWRGRAVSPSPERYPVFDALCARHGIAHQVTKPNHPWTDKQVETMNLLLRMDTANTFHFKSRRQAQEQAQNFRTAYNSGRRLKSLSGLTPLAFLCRTYEMRPELFNRSPY